MVARLRPRTHQPRVPPAHADPSPHARARGPLKQISVELIQYLPRPAASPAGLTTANRMFPICVHLKGQNSGTPEFWWSILFASKFLRRRWIAPKSDVSDFGYFKRAEVGNTPGESHVSK